MKPIRKSMLCLGVLALAALAWSPPAYGQVTTGTITGIVLDPDGAPLPGASVEAIHTPTGTRYSAYTRGDGRFNIINVRTGGPYEVTVTLAGFTTAEETDASVGLGETLNLTFTLRLAAVEEVITVTAVSDPIINSGRTGATSNVSAGELETLPTLSRDLVDFMRTDPYFTPSASNDGPTQVSVAGRNNRYNNIQIDGSVNNDLFGLAAQGTPGGQTETQPISLDAVEELQLVVSPYDVRQGGFTGGGINAVTRTGSNAWHGSGYFFTRSDTFVGNGPEDREYGEFSDRSIGGRVGGPIIRDKLFFFVNAEINRRDTPAGWSIGGSTGQNFGHEAEAARFQQIMAGYGLDVGSTEEFIRETNNDLIFARIDANVAEGHQLTVRHNYVNGDNLIQWQSPYAYSWPVYHYNIAIKTNSFVTQLNSVFGDDIFNELRFTYQTIKGPRFGPVEFPAVRVYLEGGDYFQAGTEQYSTANNLDQVIWELNDDLTFYRGGHTITLGTHNEFFDFDNLFIRQSFGSYRFNSLDDLEAGTAYQYDYSFSTTDDPLQSAKWGANQIGFYAGDNWAVRDNVNLTYGVRLDVPLMPDKPTYNPQADEIFGIRTDEVPSGNLLWSPRVGFNWDLMSDGTQQLRGGVGLFTGRPAYVWISNQYSNTGIEFSRISAYGSIPFNPDPYDQPTDIGGAATNEINASDPDFKYPSLLRTTVGYDREIGWQDMTFTGEFIYSNTVNDVLFQNLNIVYSGETAFDGRPVYERFNSALRDVIWLTNTSDGSQWNAILKVQRPFRGGWTASGSYAYGKAWSVNDGTSSQARSNWRYNEVVDPNFPTLGIADFDVRHRISATMAYDFDLGDYVRASLGFFYDGQQGRPYSTTFRYSGSSTDINNDFSGYSNDLIWVPNSADDVIVIGGTPEQLEAYIASDPGLDAARGTIVDKNASRAPWRNVLDFRGAVDFPIGSTSVEVSLDIINVLNLLNSDWGVIEYVSYDQINPFTYQGIDAATGKPIYEIQSAGRDPNGKFTMDDRRSRWQMKLGFRFLF